VATLLGRTYGASLAVIGLFTTVAFFAELAVMIPGGRGIDRWGAKRAGLVSILISLVANLLLLIPTNVVAALALRWLAGIGVGVGFLAGAIYAQSDAGRSVALAGGIYGGVSLGGGGLALAIVPQLVGAFGWRAPYVSAAIVAALAIPLVALGPHTAGHGRSRSGPAFFALMADRRLMRLGLISSVSFGFSVILGNWVVTLLERTGGLARGTAGAIGSLLLLLGIVGRPAGGLLVRAFPRLTRRTLAASFLAGALGTAVITLSLGAGADTVAAALAGLAAGIPFGVTVSGAARAYPDAGGAAVGAMNTYPVITIVCGAPLVGLAFGLPGHGRIGFAVLAALWLCAIAILGGLELTPDHG
jgi:MFS family permease